MKRFLWITMLVMLTVLCGAAGALGEQGGDVWPPEGKEEGVAGWVFTNDMTGEYLFNYEGDGVAWSTDLFPKGSIWDDSKREAATRVNVRITEGDSAFSNAFSVYEGLNGLSLFYDRYAVQQEGEASYVIDIESDHYWVSVPFTARFIDAARVNVTLLSETMDCTEGETVEGGYDKIGNFALVEPAIANSYVDFRSMNGDGEEETDEYRLFWYQFTGKKPGSYPLMLRIKVGRSNTEFQFPVTANVISAKDSSEKWEASWPPAGKKQAKDVTSHSTYTVDEDLNGNYFINGGEESSSYGFAPYYLVNSKGQEELVQSYHITFISGNEQMKNFFTQGTYGDSEPNLQVSYARLSEAGTAEFRIDMVSENCWATKSANPRVVNAEAVKTELISNVVNIPVGTETYLGELFEEKVFVRTEPEYEYHCDILTADGEWEKETDNYSFRYRFLAKNPGDYPMTLRVSIGVGLYRDFPITVHAAADITEAAVEGDAPKSAKTLRQEAEAAQQAQKAQKTQKASNNGEEEDDRKVETDCAAFFYSQKYGVTSITRILPKQEDIVIPAMLEGNAVTTIDMRAMEDSARHPVKSIVIEEGITLIRNYAFQNMKELERVQLPETLTALDSGVFSGCKALKEINLPAGLDKGSIRDSAFRSIGMEQLILADGTDLMAVSAEAYQKDSRSGNRLVMSAYAEPYTYLVREDGGAILLEDSRYDETSLQVPSEINGHPVREIGYGVYNNRSRLTRVELPEGLEVIGDEAFAGCSGLAEVRLPASIMEIGSRAFTKVAIEAIPLPENDVRTAYDWFSGAERTDSTGKWTFQLLADHSAGITGYECVSSLIFPETVDGHPVTAIQQSYTENIDLVKEIVLPDTVRLIGDSAFSGMNNLTKISWPENLERIGRSAFRNTGFREVELPEGLKTLGEQAFASCGSLRKVSFPSTLEIIEKEAFRSTELTGVTFREGLLSIGEEAFYGQNIQELVFPASLRTIGNAAFHPNDNKTPAKVTFLGFSTEIGKGVFGYSLRSGRNQDPENWRDYYVSKTGWKAPTITLSCYPGSTADRLYQANVKKKYLEWGPEASRTAPADRVLAAGLYGPDELIAEITVPEGVEEIAEGAFRDMKALSRITLPSTLKTIGAGAFAGCGALQKITLPAGVTEIPDSAFLGCESLTKVELPKAGIKRIGSRAFNNCSALTDLRMAKGLEEIGDFAFSSSGLKKASVPDTVVRIGEGAFSATPITSLTLPKGLTEIPDNLCYNAHSLKKITLPKGITKIGIGAFSYCPIGSLNLPEGLESIGEGAFMQSSEKVKFYYSGYKGRKGAGALKSLKLPASLKVISENAFACNDSLTAVTFAKGARLEEIGGSAFAMCLNLKELKLPDSVKTIGDSAFINCLGLKKADLGGSVASVGEGAFKYDAALTSLTVPDTLTAIGAGLLEEHGSGLTVVCGQGSAMEEWLKANEPTVTISYPRPGKK